MVSDNARLGIMPNIGIKGSIMVEGAATPYDSGSPMQEGTGYLGSPDYGAAFSPIVQSGGATPGGFTEYQPQGFGGGSSPYSSRSPGGYSPSVYPLVNTQARASLTLEYRVLSIPRQRARSAERHPRPPAFTALQVPAGHLFPVLASRPPPYALITPIATVQSLLII